MKIRKLGKFMHDLNAVRFTRVFVQRTVLFAGALIAIALSSAAQARSLYGTVTSVQSAEVLTFAHDAGSYTVRIYGVSVPDNAAARNEAKQFVENFVAGRSVRAMIMTRNAQNEMESIISVDSADLGLAMVRNGLAGRTADVHYKLHSNDEPDALVLAEDEARLARRGIWRTASKKFSLKNLFWPSKPVLSKTVLANGTVDVNASKKSGDDNECALAIDPSNPLRMFQACNTASAGLFAAKSSDGGATWTYPDPSDKTIADGDPGQGVSACCDATLAWDRFGNLYVTYIDQPPSAIVTLLSTDGGSTFTPLASFSGSVDQPTVVAADVGSNANVWIVWNASGAMVARGAVATALGTVGAFAAQQTIPGATGCSFGDIAIGPSGAVAQVCESPTGGQNLSNLRFNVDADGLGAGAFGASSVATTTNVGGFDFIPAQNGRSVDAEAALAFDAKSTSPFFGRLYLVYTEEPTNENNDMNIMLRSSNDNGTTWTAPVKVNDDVTNRSQFLPKLAVDPTSGKVGVCWHDARNSSASNNTMEMYCAISSDGGVTFAANSKLSDGVSTSNGAGVEYGDYMGLSFVAGKLQPVWGDTSNSTSDNPNTTANFDAYTDSIVVAPVTGGGVFANGFETSDNLFADGFE
jgi:endonuclease YncB( thermonuclease family)